MAQGNFGGGGGYVPPNPTNPYANLGASGVAPPPKKTNIWIWVLGIVGGLGILTCGCCGGATYWAYSFGVKLIADQTKQDVQNKPAVQEHIGTIETATVNNAASNAEAKKHAPGENYIVVTIKGNKGTGDVVGRIPLGAQRMSDKVLRLPDGKEIPLD